MPWQIRIDEGTVATATMALAVDVDPRTRTLSLGLRPRTGGGPEIASGAVARTFLEVDAVSWESAIAWLAGEEAAALLARMEAGYEVETLWTGDLLASWSEDAFAAGAAMVARIAELAER
jgi:hypothetical protein